MSSIDFHTKISGHEAYAWIKNCLENHSLLPEDEEQLRDFIISHKPKDFKNPRKQRVSKKSSSERSSEPKDETRCDAIIWLKDGKVGYAGQCSRKKKGDNTLCSFHQKEADNHCGCTRFGLFDVTRYTHAYNNPEDTLHAWHDVEMPDKPKKEKKSSSNATKGTRKCSLCGECGHNKRKCPQRNDSTENVAENNTENVLPPVDESNQDTGAGTGLPVETTQEEFNQARVNLSNSIAESNDSQETVLLVPDNQDELDEDLSLDDQPDDESETNTITYQGVKYLYDKDEGEILDSELTPIGDWDGVSIKFYNKELQDAHEADPSYSCDTDIQYEGIDYKLSNDGKSVYACGDDEKKTIAHWDNGDITWADDKHELQHMRKTKANKAAGKCD